MRRLEDGQYVLQSPDEASRFWIPELSLKLGLWYGERLSRTTHWLRWWNQANQRLLWSNEQAEVERERAEIERARADVLATKLRELGIDPNSLT